MCPQPSATFGRRPAVISEICSCPFGPVLISHLVDGCVPTTCDSVTDSAGARSSPYDQLPVPKSHAQGCAPSDSGVWNDNPRNFLSGSAIVVVTFIHDLLFGISTVVW